MIVTTEATMNELKRPAHEGMLLDQVAKVVERWLVRDPLAADI